jgi:hypothetical protein
LQGNKSSSIAMITSISTFTRYRVQPRVLLASWGVVCPETSQVDVFDMRGRAP